MAKFSASRGIAYRIADDQSRANERCINSTTDKAYVRAVYATVPGLGANLPPVELASAVLHPPSLMRGEKWSSTLARVKGMAARGQVSITDINASQRARDSSDGSEKEPRRVGRHGSRKRPYQQMAFVWPIQPGERRDGKKARRG